MPAYQLEPASRYLVPFRPKRVPHVFTDVLIIGAGIAGVRAALEVDPQLETLVITKSKLQESNSTYAQGGIAGVLDPVDKFSCHVADTVNAGTGLCDSEVVEMVVREAPARIRELITYGAQFDETDGKLALTQEGGHNHRRVAHALGDATGKEVMRALHHTIKQRASAQIWESTFTVDLLTHEESCRGALVWSPSHGKTLIWAKQTILATGGAGQLYRETTNPAIATADGHAIALRAGVELRDMEMMQFHPTVLYIAGGARHLISEAVRGEGAYLRNVFGDRFMGDYNEAKELAPRDIVSRAITDQMEKTAHPCVYLDLTHLDSELVTRRFPHIGRTCSKFGLDIHNDLIPVRPGAHYMIGGVTVDVQARTSLPNLWAAGEATSSGLHGANRLGSNSLLEGLVYGIRAGAGASQQALTMADNFSALPISSVAQQEVATSNMDLNLTDIRNALTSLMWRLAGIRRTAAGLEEATQQVEFWNRYVSQREFYDPQGWELRNMLTTARMLIVSALKREESRGVHFRSDFPQTNSLAEHITLTSTR